ncbi:MAG: dihydrodipicolinate reductase [Anaerolineae bacterium]|nr:dihydrodipicolinate reductase [Anaerolineae bacterium]
MEAPVRVAAYGLGPIGRAIAAAAAAKKSLDLVGAVDVAPDIAGRPLSDVVAGGPRGISVAPSLARLLDACQPEVVLHATGSYLDRVYPQFQELVQAGLNVVSTCEDASYPTTVQARLLTEQLDRACKEAGVRVLATGINPGFAMDVWPLVVSAAQARVDRILVRRVVDASTRREPLQRKIGAGMTAEEFRKEVAARRLGHVGLEASALLLAKGLGRRVLEQSGSIEPVLADREVVTEYFQVPPGRVVGLRQELRCQLSGGAQMILHLEMFLGAPEPVDEVTIEGDHEAQVKVVGGFPGDTATAAVVTNAVLPSLRCPPGYLTMLDLPFFGCMP